MGGGPQPPVFLKSCQLASKHTRLFDDSDASVVFANREEGGGAPPPTPGFRESRANSILSKPMMRALCLRMAGGGGGGAPPALFR